MDVVAEAVTKIAREPEKKVPGYRITWEPPVLRHFTSRLEPIR
ncbi:tryptophanase [Cutibacterium acnes JCM 18916]|nr:tryptophanase [Cutibacterium acnes JCM 18916]